MSLPALHALRSAGLPLILAGRPWARDLLAGLNPVQFIAIEGPLRRDIATLRSELPRDGAALRGLCFPDSLSSALVFRLAGVRACGYRDDGRSLLLTWPIAKPKGPLHAVQAYYRLGRAFLQRMGLASSAPEQPGPDLRLPLTSGHVHTAQTLLAHSGPGRPFVLISPTATGLHHGKVKAWQHYEALTRALQADGWAVVMCPPPHEVDIARAAAPSAQVLPPLPLGAFAALTRHAALVICNDSGTSHVAAAAQARQLTLFGVTHPARTAPWSRAAAWLAGQEGWPDYDEVLARARELLASTALQDANVNRV
ncbi:glycosyltransferase family 9 protein [Verticiella sediminum]